MSPAFIHSVSCEAYVFSFAKRKEKCRGDFFQTIKTQRKLLNKGIIRSHLCIS